MWFSASLLIKSQSLDRPEDECLWEESIVLIEAEAESEAKLKAEVFGRERGCEYESATGERLRWTFERVERVHSIEGELRSGTELFGRFLRNSEAMSLLTPFDD